MRTFSAWLVLLVMGTAPIAAAELSLDVEIPRLDVSEYHRPYVAIWVQDEDQKVAANLAVWYQIRGSRKGHGTKWLPDLRQWWRRSGRGLEMPVDGISSATRPAGKHELKFNTADSELAKLKPGKYTLLVEASREVGGRELVEISFEWPKKTAEPIKVRGGKELGEVVLTITP
ncbi:hypothetical protein CGZ80_15650 [Rhodopirellula sp. MGV]|nr:hypothetical protein CGZ80_15650 [Rhodopirellula sp. MGV]PNY35038.1 DUF2271 domain-containing protein [Rhodopirellula baltica]